MARIEICTLGFNAQLGSGNGFVTNGFVTNSHCTKKRGEVEGTQHSQPWPGIIGTEILDPPFFTGSPCPSKRKCSYADVAFDQLSQGVTAELGYLMRTDSVNLGSLTIDGRFRIVGEAPSNAGVGETLNKVGRTTGWTQGNVTNSCANVNVAGTTIIMLCQDRVAAASDGGDSGSPAFKISDNPQQPNDVILYGILWGGSLTGVLNFTYSPMAGVQRIATPGPSLGPLTNCATGFAC